MICVKCSQSFIVLAKKYDFIIYLQIQNYAFTKYIPNNILFRTVIIILNILDFSKTDTSYMSYVMILYYVL